VPGRRAALWRTGAVAVALLAAAGCDSTTAGHGTAGSPPYAFPSASRTAPGPGTGTGSGPGSGTGSGTGPGSPTAPTSAAPSAADGTNVAACADARCEVLVRTGTPLPVPRTTTVRNLRVQVVTSRQVTLRGSAIGDASAGSCTGDCSSASINGEFSVTMGADSQTVQNGLSVTVVRVGGDGTAILKLVPAG
jgi:hypothetical protein